jgi:hypothetical protein
MDFGWAGKAFWIVAVVIVIGTIWYSKRHRVDPPDKPEQ